MSEKTSPEQQAILDHLQAQSNILRSQTFSTPTAQVSLDQALENAGTLKGKVVVITGAAGIGFGANYSKRVAKFGFALLPLSPVLHSTDCFNFLIQSESGT